MPEGWCRRYGIEVVPLTVHFGEESFRDRVDLGDDEFFDRLERAARLPTTAAPAPGAFAEAYRRLGRDCEGVISIHIAGRLSGTVEAARVAAGQVPEVRVHVVDSGSLTICLAFLCRVAAESPTLAEAVAAVEERLPRQRILAVLDTLKYVEMGGRVSRAQAMIGTMLDLKPILGLADGEIKSLDRVRTRGRAIARLVELLREDLPVEHLAVMHARAPEDAERIREQLAKELPGQEIALGQIGAVLATHAGPRAVGLAYLKAG